MTFGTFTPSQGFAERHPERFPNYVPPTSYPDYVALLREVFESEHDNVGDVFVVAVDPELWIRIEDALAT